MSPVTRLSTLDWLFGCTNWVFSPAPMLNEFQLMTAFWLDWLMVTFAVPVPDTVALPPTTCEPSGLANAAARPERHQRGGGEEQSAHRGNSAAHVCPSTVPMR